MMFKDSFNVYLHGLQSDREELKYFMSYAVTGRLIGFNRTGRN